MEMEDQYGMSDLRQFITRAAAGGPQFPPFGQQQQQQPSSLSELLTAHHHHRGLTTPTAAAAAAAHQHHYNSEMVVMGRHMGAAAAAAAASSGDMLHHHQNHHHLDVGGGVSRQSQYHDHFNCGDSTTTTATQGNNFEGGDAGAARWPRQETLTLLEIRSRLDHKFKEANQKGPLWDEVARIMCEEHGYQRTGKKCREKFENLYKYYKKTKEGKAGRQDGKHYRFFRQLEALYGEHHNPNSTSDTHITGNTPQFHTTHPIIPLPQGSVGVTTTTTTTNPLARPPSVSLSNSSDFETTSSDEDDMNGSMESGHGSMERRKQKRRGKRSWKAKIKEFIDLQMRKIMEKQEAWVEKMMTTLESREHERMVREDEWRKQEADRVEREHKFWASERAWIESRDSALMSALERLTSSNTSTETNTNSGGGGGGGGGGGVQWPEHEVTRLIQVRTSMESRFQQCGFSEEVLWDDIATKMAYLGYDRSPVVCKEKWDSINSYFREKGKMMMLKNEGKKKRKENYGVQQQLNNLNHHHHIHSRNDDDTTNNDHQQQHQHQGGGTIYMNQLSGFNHNCEINEPRIQLNEGSSSPSSQHSNVNVSNAMNDNCFRFFLGDHGAETSLAWDSNNYGLNKLNKGENQCA